MKKLGWTHHIKSFKKYLKQDRATVLPRTKEVLEARALAKKVQHCIIIKLKEEEILLSDHWLCLNQLSM